MRARILVVVLCLSVSAFAAPPDPIQAALATGMFEALDPATGLITVTPRFTHKPIAAQAALADKVCTLLEAVAEKAAGPNDAGEYENQLSACDVVLPGGKIGDVTLTEGAPLVRWEVWYLRRTVR